MEELKKDGMKLRDFKRCGQGKWNWMRTGKRLRIDTHNLTEKWSPL